MRLGLIGYGNIGRSLVAMIAADPALTLAHLCVLVRNYDGQSAPDGAAQGVSWVTNADALIAASPDVIIECAGHSAVVELVPQCLAAGIDTVVASIGALADQSLEERLIALSEESGARLILPAGAIGGIDLLSALRPSGIQSVTYIGRKPPMAWAGSPAEKVVDLTTLTQRTTFFSGTAREAAAAYPKNANVAATLALAGVGMDATQVQLIADPAATGNTHSYSVFAGGADYTVDITGKSSKENPKTSIATVYSLLREVRNRLGPVAI
ncbi:MAG: aspartate dehydrogenase [Paracoccaceae bacterium]|jgi:aspartate dehydrogenase